VTWNVCQSVGQTTINDAAQTRDLMHLLITSHSLLWAGGVMTH